MISLPEFPLKTNPGINILGNFVSHTCTHCGPIFFYLLWRSVDEASAFKLSFSMNKRKMSQNRVKCYNIHFNCIFVRFNWSCPYKAGCRLQIEWAVKGRLFCFPCCFPTVNFCESSIRKQRTRFLLNSTRLVLVWSYVFIHMYLSFW